MLANAHAAACVMLSESREAPVQASKYVVSVQKASQWQPHLFDSLLNVYLQALGDVTSRERLYGEAVIAWCKGDVDEVVYSLGMIFESIFSMLIFFCARQKAIKYHFESLRACPKDVVNAKLCMMHLFNIGDTKRSPQTTFRLHLRSSVDLQ